MKIKLLPELFDPPVSHSLLIALLNYPLHERHRVELDVGHRAVAAWLASPAPGLREEIGVALDQSVRAEALEPSHTVVEVVRATSNYRAQPVRVSVDDARRFFDDALVVLLEDAQSDRWFLECMMTQEERRFFQKRINDRFVRVDHGGGLESMTKRMDAEVNNQERQHRYWVLFDSDAMQPGVPSAASEALRSACKDIAHHQLTRRYAESYLTLRALHGWASGSPRRETREHRLASFKAFAAMTENQRYHYNMKHGFERDARRTDAKAGDLFGGILPAARQALAHGFGSDIAQLFADGLVTEADLRREGGWDELRPAVRDLLARMR